MDKTELRDKNGLNEKEFLDSYKEGHYPHPSVTADILIFSQADEKIELLMIRRGGHPYLGCWALPGGFSNPNESVDRAAERELAEETHVEGLPLMQLGMFSDPGRDPRTWIMTQAYIAVVDKATVKASSGDDADEVAWFTVNCNYNGEKAVLSLSNDSTELSAVLHIVKRETPLGILRNINIVSTAGIAFDHAKIIMTGLFRLKEKCI